MDGVHDLGGVQGFGPVNPDKDERPFKATWEGRMWGINKGISGVPGWSIDWFRHVRELIEPVDYLTRPYFDQWAQTYGAMLVDSGVVTIEELATGISARPALERRPPMQASAVAAAARSIKDFSRAANAAPRFLAGDILTTRSMGAAGHTRMPRYVRGRRGRVHACHGAFLVADESAFGREIAEPLYTVGFLATDLWPETGARNDRVFVDLWERYLE